MQADRPVRGDDVIPLVPLWELLRQQKQWLKFGLAGLLLSGLLLVGTVLFLAPKTEVCSMDLSLGFKGAQNGKYPNDLPFSAEELLDCSVLRAVYERHNLQQWIEFPAFESALSISQSSGNLQNVIGEYSSRFNNSKLSGPDRQALEQEYRSRLRSAFSTVFRLAWFDGSRSPRVPLDVKAKVLSDIPVIWAKQAVSNKQIYSFSSHLPGLNANYEKEGQSEIEKFAAINNRARALEEGLLYVEKLPGASLVALSDGTTVVDLKLRLRAYREQTLPSIQDSMLTQIGTNQEIMKLSQAMELQLKFRESRAKSSQDRLSALVETYRDYLAGRPGSISTDTGGPVASTGGRFVEIFLNRLLGLAQTGADRDYLRKMLEEIEKGRIQATQDELSCQELRQNLEMVRSALARQGAERPAGSPLQPPPPQEDRATSGIAASLRDSAAQLGLLLDSSRQLVIAISESYLGHHPDLFSVTRGWELKKVQPLSRVALILALVAWVVLGFFSLLMLLFIKHRIGSLSRSARQS
jgi:hypothetical protein